jgi:RNA polymerase sigma-70 factor (ECF subfamily)
MSLLPSARAGDRGSLGRLAVLASEQLYPFVFRTTLSRDVTEDVLQETLLALVSRLDSLRDDRKFWPWIFRIAWTKVQNTRRSRQLQTALRRHPRASVARHGNDESALDATIRAEALAQIAAAVEQLSRQHRDILHLRTYEQLPYTEIASRTQTTPEKARVRFHRAKNTLKAHLQTCSA